jgi:uncharacterized protein (TIGR04255 family)
VAEIALERAPLVRVVAQVRFPRLSVFQTPNPIGPFVEKVAREYPLLAEKKEIQLVATPSGILQQPSDTRTWEMRSADEQWTVTINEAFLALTTFEYKSRVDFISRFDSLVSVFTEIYNPPFGERLGIRYTNRLTGARVLDHLPDFFRAEVLAGLAIPTAGKASVKMTISDTIFELDRRTLQVRWGLVPANASIDIQIPGLNEPSWVIDLDSFNSHKIPFSSEALDEELRQLAGQAYSMFRWMITNDFFGNYQEIS